jgi:hypothetical protein
MNGSQFTHKAQDAILAAQDLARELGTATNRCLAFALCSFKPRREALSLMF